MLSTHGPANQIPTIVDSSGPTTTNAYDTMKRLHQQTVSGSGGSLQVTTFEYDALDRLASITNPLNQQTTYQYDATHIRSQPSSVTEPGNRTTSYVYNSVDELVQKTDPRGGVTSYEYDQRGNLVSLVDSKGAKTQYAYDFNNRKTKESRPSVVETRDGVADFQAAISYLYAPDDQILREDHYSDEGAVVQSITSAYDELGRLRIRTLKTPLNEDVANYEYSPQIDADLITTASNSAAIENFDHESAPPFANTSFTLAAAQSGNPLGLAVGTYTNQIGVTGDVTQVTNDSRAVLMNRSYDSAGRLTAASSGAFSAAIGYDGFGRKTSQSNSDGNSSTISYDSLNRTTGTAWTGNSPLSESLTYDAAGVIQNLARESHSYSLSYDANNQLVSSTGSSGAPFANFNFDYDGMGNRQYHFAKGALGGLSKFLPKSAARMLTGDDAPNNFLDEDEDEDFVADSDGLGEVIHQTAKNSNGLTGDYVYRADGRTVSFTTGGNSVQNFYDPFDRLIARKFTGSSSAFTQSYTYLGDTDSILQGVSGNGTSTVYLDGTEGEHLGEASGSNQLGYETDHLGSVLNGPVAGAAKEFGHFGSLPTSSRFSKAARAKSAFTLDGSSSAVNYAYAGYNLDPLSTNYLTGARMYDPDSGTFLSQDPEGHDSGDDNYYRYAGNNPLINTDPTGLSARDVEKLKLVVAGQTKDLNDEGLRRSGNANLNNIAAFFNGGKQLGCILQARTLKSVLNSMKRTKQFDAKWTFTVIGSDSPHFQPHGGVQSHLSLFPHWWVEGVSDDPNDPRMILDTWKNAALPLDPAGSAKSCPGFLDPAPDVLE